MNYKELVLLASLGIVGCTNNEMTEIENSVINSITISVDNSSVIDNDYTTRIVTDNSAGLVPSIFFTNQDRFGILATEGESSQISFAPTSLADGERSANVVIDAGAWNTKVGYHYVSYLPYSLTNTDPKKIPVSYLGQKQMAKGDASHLSKTYFLASEPSAADNGAFNFQNRMMGTLLIFDITLPEAATLTKFEIASDNPTQFGVTGTLDLTAAGQPYTATKTSNTMTLDLNNISVDANTMSRYYVYMPAPTDFTGRTLTFTLYSPSTGKKYVCTESQPNISGLGTPKRERDKKGRVTLTANMFSAQEDNTLGTLTGTVQ